MQPAAYVIWKMKEILDFPHNWHKAEIETDISSAIIDDGFVPFMNIKMQQNTVMVSLSKILFIAFLPVNILTHNSKKVYYLWVPLRKGDKCHIINWLLSLTKRNGMRYNKSANKFWHSKYIKRRNLYGRKCSKNRKSCKAL